MIRVCVAGALGRMGSRVIKAVQRQEDMRLVAGIEAEGNPSKGKDIGKLIGIGEIGTLLATSEELENTLSTTRPDVLVDFTIASAATRTAKISAEKKVNLVIGTTGFSDDQVKEIRDAIKKNGISAVISPNMATGVNIFLKIAKDAAQKLRDYDVEIIEAHHRHKKDAPSGTAIKTGELIAQVIGRELGKVAIFGRKGTMERGKEIGIHAIRGGDVIGEHTVLFLGEGERLEITHRAHSRDAFVNGTLKAIRFIYENQGRGKIYSTWDVLGIK
jgi:4-hydroxy-tetrahydrodipicolinate reductase